MTSLVTKDDNKTQRKVMFRSMRISRLLLSSLNLDHLVAHQYSKLPNAKLNCSKMSEKESTESVWKVLSQCGVCEKSLTPESCPQLMPCCHNACKECIDDELAAIQDLINTNNTEGSLSKCKICSQEFSPKQCIENSFKIPYCFQSQSNESEDSEKVCQSCEGQNKSAVIRCETCDWICSECRALHKTIKILKEHILDESTTIENCTKDKNLCLEHNELITVYCKNCKTAYCARCILKEHNLHIYEDTKDSEQMKQFYTNLTKQVEQIVEKRSFTENILEKFVTIETDVSQQRNECIEKIKSFTNRLQEKIAELGTSMLDKVNTVCQQKETEFNSKKFELNQLNYSFKYIEQFMSAILQLNDPMAVLKAQELFNSQLEKLLNKPCTHPDFVKPFKIDVLDSLRSTSTGFSVEKMIDGVFNMCFKITTSDDPIEKTNEVNQQNNNNNNNNNNEEEIIEIIPNQSSLRSTQTSHNFRDISTVPHNPVVTTAMPQLSYGNPQLYRGPLQNRLTTNSLILPNSVMNQQNYSNNRTLNLVSIQNTIPNSIPPNVTIHNQMPFMPNAIHIQQIPQQIQQLSVQQTPFNQNVRTYAGGTITASINQNSNPYRSTITQRLPQPQQHHLQQQNPNIGLTNPVMVSQLRTPITNISTDPRRLPNAVLPQTQQRFPANGLQNNVQQITNTNTLFNNRTAVNNTQVPNRRHINRDLTSPNSAQIHIPEQQMVRQSTPPQPQPQPQSQLQLQPQPQPEHISPNNQSIIENRRNSEQTPLSSAVAHSETNGQSGNQSNKETVTGIHSRSLSTDSGIQTPPISMPILTQTADNEPQSHESTNDTERTSDSPSLDSVICVSNASTNSNENLIEKEVSTPLRPTAPVARIPPLTPETQSSDQTEESGLEEDIDEDADCVVCLKEYGEFICCERCPRTFHNDCHVPELKKMPESAFICTFCKAIPQMQSNGGRKSKKGLNEVQQAICERILIGLFCHKKSQHFKHPNSDAFPQNINFKVIKKKLEENKYEDEQQFILDVQQVFIDYNSVSNVSTDALNDYKIVESFFKKLVHEFMPNFAEFARISHNREATTETTSKRNRLT